jgi:hypothetical protein
MHPMRCRRGGRWRPWCRGVELRSGRRRECGATREFLGKTKVCEDDVTICTNEDVFRFEVTIDYAGSMETIDTFNLRGKWACFSSER